MILKLSKRRCRQSAMPVRLKKDSYGVSAAIRPAFHTSKHARNICWISSGWAARSLVWLEHWMCLLRALGGKLSPQSVFRFAPDRRTSVYKGSVLTCFFQDPCLSVVTQFPADLPLFLPTVCVCVCVCVCVKAGPGNAQNTSVIARRGLSESGTSAAVLEPLLRLSGQASPTGL